MLIEPIDCDCNLDTQGVGGKKGKGCCLFRKHIRAPLNQLPLQSINMVQILLFLSLLWKETHHICHYCSTLKILAMTYDNKIAFNITTSLKSFKTQSAQAFSQLKVLVYADNCIYIVCMRACTYMHNFNTELCCI